MNLIKAAEGADLLSGSIMLYLGKYTALKHAASLDCAALNYTLLHYTKLWTVVMINGGKCLSAFKQKEKERRRKECYVLMQNLACFFPLTLPIQLSVVQEQKIFF